MFLSKAVYFWFLVALLSIQLIVVALVGKRVRHVLSNGMGYDNYVTCFSRTYLSAAPEGPSINNKVMNKAYGSRASPISRARSP